MADQTGSIGLAAGLLAASRHAVAMTGAGVSVESGIPTFRGDDGLWARLGGPDHDQYQRFLADPQAYWKRELERSVEPYVVELRKTVAVAGPNNGHRALARLEALGVLQTVITQNIDGLHQSAGSRQVLEIHGSRYKMRCVDCGDRTPREDLFLSKAPSPCARCGGRVKFDSVLFGEPIPRAVLEDARAETDRADCVLVVGTSATVRPAGGLPRIARANGARLIEVNPNSTGITSLCDVAICETAAIALPLLADAVSERLRKRG
ncbi:MAG: NAD-dependent deacetylase [Chloroflexi bacterium]|nr:NAD-dependent deacetylase [Chloroflexota bacterium]